MVNTVIYYMESNKRLKPGDDSIFSSNLESGPGFKMDGDIKIPRKATKVGFFYFYYYYYYGR